LKTISTLCFAASTMLAASSAMAWESEDAQHSTSASVALSSDYVWRGVSQTQRDAAISGSFDYSHASGLYAGVWASNVDEFVDGDKANLEIDTYAGYSSELGDTGIGYDIGWLRYIYPGIAAGLDYDWNEYHLALSYSYFSASVNYTNEVYGDGGDNAVYYTFGGAYEFENGVAIDANIGAYDYSDEATYGDDAHVDWNIGVSKELAGFGLDVRYFGSDSDLEAYVGSSDPSDSVVFTISKSM